MELTPLSTPLASPLWALAEFRIERPELRELLGEPHFVETDGSRTFGGEEDLWAFVLASEHRIGVVLRVPYARAIFYSEPAELSAVLLALGLLDDDPRLEPYSEAFIDPY